MKTEESQLFKCFTFMISNNSCDFSMTYFSFLARCFKTLNTVVLFNFMSLCIYYVTLFLAFKNIQLLLIFLHNFE